MKNNENQRASIQTKIDWAMAKELKYFGNDESTESYLSHIEETIKRIAKEERPKLKRKAKEERQKKKRKN